MSHFTILVTGDDHVAALAPFHEFECTGINDEYVQDIDQTAEKRAEYEADTETRMREIATGALFPRFDEKGDWVERFSVPAPDSAFGGMRRVSFTPEGFEEIQVPSKEVYTFRAWLEYDGHDVFMCNADAARTMRVQHPNLIEAARRAGIDTDADDYRYGYIAVDEASGEVICVVRRTNPNKKWDWYQVGGRWAGKLRLKNGARADEAAAGDVDWDGAILEQGAKAGLEWDKVRAIIAGRPYTPWRAFVARAEAKEITWDEARTAHNAQPVVADLHKDEALRWDGTEIAGEVIAMSRPSYVERKGYLNASTWGLLHAGKWAERGDMGWWGMSDATDASMDAQTALFWDTVRALPPATRLTVVDCHI